MYNQHMNFKWHNDGDSSEICGELDDLNDDFDDMDIGTDLSSSDFAQQFRDYVLDDAALLSLPETGSARRDNPPCFPPLQEGFSTDSAQGQSSGQFISLPRQQNGAQGALNIPLYNSYDPATYGVSFSQPQNPHYLTVPSIHRDAGHSDDTIDYSHANEPMNFNPQMANPHPYEGAVPFFKEEELYQVNDDFSYPLGISSEDSISPMSPDSPMDESVTQNF